MCFKCYKMESHLTKNCPKKQQICSECAETGHTWRDCKSETKKCLKCEQGHRTMAMAWPIPKKKLLTKPKMKKEKKKTKKYDLRSGSQSDDQ